jgi:FkbM family methyltransferase
MIRAFQKVRHYHSTLGPGGAIAFIGAKLFGTRPLFKMRVAGISHPVYLRIGTTDASVLRQVLVEKHYDLPVHIVPKVIVDAGANIGLSAVYFANKYPGATIIALEPEESNFQLLQKNVDPYPQIRPVRAALWKENRQISLIDPRHGHHGFQTMEGTPADGKPSGLVQALTMDTLMARMEVESVDLLKIDIEGSEKEVFENSAKWMAQVGVIMAELHDTIKPGCSQAFLAATKDFAQQFSNGETVVRLRTADH